jgi:hypothetical protein
MLWLEKEPGRVPIEVHLAAEPRTFFFALPCASVILNVLVPGGVKLTWAVTSDMGFREYKVFRSDDRHFVVPREGWFLLSGSLQRIQNRVQLWLCCRFLCV